MSVIEFKPLLRLNVRKKKIYQYLYKYLMFKFYNNSGKKCNKRYNIKEFNVLHIECTNLSEFRMAGLELV